MTGSVEVLAVTSEEAKTHQEFYKEAGELMLEAAACNGRSDFADAKLYMDLAQAHYQRGHALNPLFNNDQPTI